MTREEAYTISLEQGLRIRHRHFGYNESIRVLPDRRIELSEGYNVPQDEFDKYRHQLYWMTDWEIAPPQGS